VALHIGEQAEGHVTVERGTPLFGHLSGAFDEIRFNPDKHQAVPDSKCLSFPKASTDPHVYSQATRNGHSMWLLTKLMYNLGVKNASVG
jgi:hypothetical protein